MEGASTSGLNCCSRDRKGKQRGEKEWSQKMELMCVLKLICSRKCLQDKSFLYLRLQMAIDIFGMNKTDNLRIFPLFNLYTYAKLPYWSILFYHNVVVTNMRPLRSPVMNWKKKHYRYLKLCSRFHVLFGTILWYFSELAPSFTIYSGQIDRWRNLCLASSGLIEIWSIIQ